MATTITGINQTKVLNQLDTYNHTTLNTGMYRVSVKATDIPTTGLVITMKNDSTTVATSTTATDQQRHIELETTMYCVAGAVIGVILASSTIGDQGGNSIKAILNIRLGTT